MRAEGKTNINLDEDVDLYDKYRELYNYDYSNGIIAHRQTNCGDLIGFVGGNRFSFVNRFSKGANDISSAIKDLKNKTDKSITNTIQAEVLFIPSGVAGNILGNQLTTKYFISLLSNKIEADKNHTEIKLNDLFIGIRNGKLVLFSFILNKYVIPVFSSAYNSSLTNHHIFRLITDIGKQYFPSFQFNWSSYSLTNYFSFFPRLYYRKTLLIPACWILRYGDFSTCKGAVFVKEFQDISRSRKIPRFVIIDSIDGEVCDFQIDDAVMKVGVSLIERKLLYLYEFIPGKEINDGSIVNTQIISLCVPERNFQHEFGEEIILKENVRVLGLSDNIIYYKVRIHFLEADKLIVQIFKDELIMSFLDRNIAGISFLRFHDVYFHLRIRLFIYDNEHRDEICKLLLRIIEKFDPLSISQDTYVRELEKFRMYDIRKIEGYFCHESRFVASLLNAIDNEVSRTLTLVYFVNSILNLTLRDIELKVRFSKEMTDYFFRDFGESKSIWKEVNSTYAEFKDQLGGIQDNKCNLFTHDKTANLFRCVHNEFIYLYDNCPNKNSNEQMDLLKSLIHLLVNRISLNNPRFEEYTLYVFLYRTYLKNLNKPKND